MSYYWRLRKKDYYMLAIDLKKNIPELNKVDAEYIASHLRGSNLLFYYNEKTPTPIWIRLTLPFGLLFMLILFVLMPVKYIISGYWGYKWMWLTNWFKALGF